MATVDSSAASPSIAVSRTSGESGIAALPRLPTYTRSLLRIEVPIVVTLAAKKQSIGQIVELGPGSIIHFDKSCDEMLDLSVCDRRIAQGEAVKVGDKFGLRVTSVVMPDERFQAVKGRA
jgi:flagellar motor switch protein FliN/FliY